MAKILELLTGAAKKAAGVAVSLIGKGVSWGLSIARSGIAAVGRLIARLSGDMARCMGKKMKKLMAPMLKGVMIVSAAVAVLSCVGWLVSRRD